VKSKDVEVWKINRVCKDQEAVTIHRNGRFEMKALLSGRETYPTKLRREGSMDTKTGSSLVD
jgi:hypothetical protein